MGSQLHEYESERVSDVIAQRHTGRPMGASLVAVAFVGLLHDDRRGLLTARVGDRFVHRLHADVFRGLFGSSAEVAFGIRDLDVCRSACGAPGTMLDFF